MPVPIHAGETPSPRPLTLGLIGGGQLAKMTAQAAAQLGLATAILERTQHTPASGLAHHCLLGDWDQPADLLRLAALSDVLTLENEFVDAEALAVLERHGHRLRPGSGTVKIVQDKLWQKQAIAEEGIAMPRFADAPSKTAALAAAHAFGWPVVLKKRRNGYDGKGNATLRSAADLDAAWQQLNGDQNALFVESWFSFEREIAVMVTRPEQGSAALYPVVETVQKDHICHVVRAPGTLPTTIQERASEMAQRAVAAVGGIGTFGVEMFLAPDGTLALNELAPRVHNSGHYTIEACECSQFENHVRAVMGWPLGSPRMRAPAAVMINLLGAGPGPGLPSGLDRALAVPGASLHLYGKTTSTRGRKMGHVTALGNTTDEAYAIARRAADALVFGTPG
ncbi:MAG: 5-(carboxyamino)imidazole ribonucleotide synthase [Verrucomicrobiales bacterium]|nr:5-(carboxyamino)imidazole ribonucleotide synthase [Verrucomicrobiales bacterium]